MSQTYNKYKAEVNQFFNNLIPNDFEKAHCAVCSVSVSWHHLFTKNTLEIVRCKNCGLVYSKVQPKQEKLTKFYEKSAAMSTWAEHKSTQEQSYKFQSAIDYINKSEIVSVLDLGCGTGSFLSYLVKNPRIRALGVDPHKESLDKAPASVQKKQSDIMGFLKDNDKVWDLISMWGVVEHLKQPLDVLFEVRKRCKELVVCVPNVNSLVVLTTWKQCFTFCPQHLWYFSIETLKLLMERAGFEYITHSTIEPEVEPYLRHRFGVDPYDKTYALSEEEIKAYTDFALKKKLGYKIVAHFK